MEMFNDYKLTDDKTILKMNREYNSANKINILSSKSQNSNGSDSGSEAPIETPISPITPIRVNPISSPTETPKEQKQVVGNLLLIYIMLQYFNNTCPN